MEEEEEEEKETAMEVLETLRSLTMFRFWRVVVYNLARVRKNARMQLRKVLVTHVRTHVVTNALHQEYQESLTKCCEPFMSYSETFYVA